MEKAFAQVSIEYLAITVFLLIVSGIIFGFALYFFNENTAIAQAQDAVTKIANHANLVASQGDGSRVFFEVEIPQNVQSFEVKNKAVHMSIQTSTGLNDVVAYSKAFLSEQTLSATGGRKTFSATFSDGNVVVKDDGT